MMLALILLLLFIGSVGTAKLPRHARGGARAGMSHHGEARWGACCGAALL
jgi:hypothetical protein